MYEQYSHMAGGGKKQKRMPDNKKKKKTMENLTDFYVEVVTHVEDQSIRTRTRTQSPPANKLWILYTGGCFVQNMSSNI